MRCSMRATHSKRRPRRTSCNAISPGPPGVACTAQSLPYSRRERSPRSCSASSEMLRRRSSSWPHPRRAWKSFQWHPRPPLSGSPDIGDTPERVQGTPGTKVAGKALDPGMGGGTPAGATREGDGTSLQGTGTAGVESVRAARHRTNEGCAAVGSTNLGLAPAATGMRRREPTGARPRSKERAAPFVNPPDTSR